MTDRNSLMADMLEELAGLIEVPHPYRAARFRRRAEALRSTPERAEQPAGGLELFTQHGDISPRFAYYRSPEAEAVIAALMPLRDNLRKDGYRGLVGLINALDRKHRGQS
jgi:hypothetical protein